jgi:hypothetical protein
MSSRLAGLASTYGAMLVFVVLCLLAGVGRCLAVSTCSRVVLAQQELGVAASSSVAAGAATAMILQAWAGC